MKGTRVKEFAHDESESEDFGDVGRESSEDDEMATVSFGALSAAQKELEASGSSRRKQRSSGKGQRGDSSEEEGSESDSDSAPSEDNFTEQPRERRGAGRGANETLQNRRNKNAPAVASSKRPVSRIREIPGLQTQKYSTMYTDIRFDPAYGKADLKQARKNYAFLDEYRQKEIKDMESVLKDKKSANLLNEREREELKLKIQSLKSRLDTMKNRDLEDEILKKHKRETIQRVKEGKQSNPYYLKKSDKRKLIQKAKFENMKGSQREKVMERKRKRRLGKEFKALEFNQRQSS